MSAAAPGCVLDRATQATVDAIDVKNMQCAAENSVTAALAALKAGNADLNAVVRLLEASIGCVMALDWVKIQQQQSTSGAHHG